MTHPAADLLRAIADGKQMEFLVDVSGKETWIRCSPHSALEYIIDARTEYLRIARPIVARMVTYPEPLQVTSKVCRNILDATWVFATEADAAEAHKALFGVFTT